MLFVKMGTALSSLTTLLPRQANTTCPTIPRCPDNNACSLTAPNGAQFRVNCFTDYGGPIIEIVRANTPSDCETACALSTECQAVNFKPDSVNSAAGFCYLLGTNIEPSRTASDVYAGLKTISAITSQPTDGSFTCSSDLSCPADDGCETTIGGKQFAVKCSTDFYGSDLSYVFVPDLKSCVQTCGSTAGCNAVSFRGGTCWLKGDVPRGLYNSQVQGAYVY